MTGANWTRWVLASALLLAACDGIRSANAPIAGDEGPSETTTATTTERGAEPATRGPAATATDPSDTTGPAMPIAEPPQPVDTTVASQVRVLTARIDSMAAQQTRLIEALAAGNAALLARGDTTPTAEDPGEPPAEPQASIAMPAIWTVVVLVATYFLIRFLRFVLDGLAVRNPDQRLFYRRMVPTVSITLWIGAAWVILQVVWRVGADSVTMRVLWTAAVLAATYYLIRFLSYVLDALAERNAERRLFYKRLVPIGRIFFWIAAVWVVLRMIWDVGATNLLAAGAAGAVAIGFAAQDILKNVFGGLVIVADRPFAAGDKVQVGDTYGEVVSVGLWSTRIVTPDDSLVSVPNSQVVSGQVSNANSGVLDCQVVTDLYLPGWIDERKAKKIAYESAAASPYVFLNKPIVVLVRDELRQTFVTNLRVKAYVLDQRYEFLFKSDVTERARDEFRKHGLLGPYHGAHPFYAVPGLPASDPGDVDDPV